MDSNIRMKTVLVGDDLGDGGAEALRQGHALAQRHAARLHVCHAIPQLGPIEGLLGTLDDTSRIEIGRAEAHARIAMAARVERITQRADVPIHVVTGSPHAAVLDTAEEIEADCVVVAVSGRPTTLQNLVLGSSAAQIVRHAHCTVLVARPGESNKVLVATDLSDMALPAVEQAIREAEKRAANLVVAHVLDLAHPVLSSLDPAVVIDEESAAALHASTRETLAAALGRFGGNAEVVVVEGKPRRAIVELAKSTNAGLVVVGTHGRTGLARVALGSVAEAVVKNAPCSVMVVREHRA